MIRPVEARTPAPVAASWRRLERWLEQNDPVCLKGLQPGATEEELKGLEAHIGQKLPADVRESWRIHNGENQYGPGGIIFGAPLCRVNIIQHYWASPEALRIRDEQFPFLFSMTKHTSFPIGAIQLRDITPGWIALRNWDGNFIGVDLDPGPNGVWGQVICFGRDENDKVVLALSWAQFLEDIADELEAGNFTLDEDGLNPISSNPSHFQFHHMYQEWAEAKLPGVFLNTPPEVEESNPVEQELDSMSRQQCIEAVRGFIDAMFDLDKQFLKQRPLRPLGVVRFEEDSEQRLNIWFDLEGSLVQSGSLDTLFDRKLTATVEATLSKNLFAGQAFNEYSGVLQDAHDRMAASHRWLDQHPLAEVYRDPGRREEFFKGGKLYQEAMHKKQEIMNRFASGMTFRPVFVQTEPSAYAANRNAILEVTSTSRTSCYVYLEAQPSLFGISQATLVFGPEASGQEQIRYVVEKRQDSWVITGREVSVNASAFTRFEF